MENYRGDPTCRDLADCPQSFLCLDLFMNKRLTGVLSSGHPRIHLSHFWRKLLHEFNLCLEVLDNFKCMKKEIQKNEFI